MVLNVIETRFGVKNHEKVAAQNSGPSRRQCEMANLRKELRNLRNRWKHADDDEKEGLKCLRDEARNRLASLRKAENLRKKSKEKKRSRKAFFENPYRFVGDLLGKPKDGHLESTLDEVEEWLSASHNDPEGDEPLEECPIHVPAPAPTEQFDNSDLKFAEVKCVVKHARSASAPGSSGITYAVYKNCPRLLRRLWKLLQSVWRTKDTPGRWSSAEGCFVPKEQHSKRIDQFREISLLDVEGKIFWAIVAKRMGQYLQANSYVNTSVQKGGVAGIKGCLEHTAVISQLLKEAVQHKKSLAMVWLDLEKAYPNVPHQLIKYSVEHYNFPPTLSTLIMSDFNRMKMRFTVGKNTTRWQNLEKGIMAGCTVSVVLFITAMNVIISAVETECRGPESISGVRHPPCRAFMDDITAMTSSITGTRWVLRGLERLTLWARMKFKPKKSRSLTIVKGQTKEHQFTISGESIPTVRDTPIKCLGKVYDSSLRDIQNAEQLLRELTRWLNVLDKCVLLGKHKVWCFQFGIVPRLQWPFLLYDISMTI